MCFVLNETFRENRTALRYCEASVLSVTSKRKFSSIGMSVEFTEFFLFVFKCLRGLKIAQLPGEIQECTQIPEWKLINDDTVLN